MTGKAESARPAGHELLITRSFDAPVSLALRLWAQREHMIRWWGPRGFTCTSLTLDFRLGGAWRACSESEAYGKSWMGGEFRAIEPHKRIVFRFAWEDGRDQPGVDTLVTVTFTEKDGQTLQSFHQAPFIHIEGRDSHIEGWNSAFDKEQAYTQGLYRGGS